MKLKYLFFPITLILAVVVFWAYITPEIDSFQVANIDYNSKQQLLKSTQEKKTLLESLSSKIQGASEDTALVYDYLPKNKQEEKIIGQLNYLATDSGIFLDNLELAPVLVPVNTEIIAPNPVGTNLVSTGVVSANPASSGPTNIDATQNIQAIITVEGEYDKLRAFFNKVERVPLFNSIKSLKVYTTDGVASANPAAAGQTTATKISAKLVVNFAYLGQIKADDKKIAVFNPEIDNATIQKLKEYINGNVPKINVNDITAGSDNPFLSQ